MSNNSCIEITMLGGFSITYQERSIDDKSKHSKKCFYLLEYLIAHRHTQINQSDLIEVLWPEETSENPIGALKTLMHRVRTLLKSIDLPKDLILQVNSTYMWNNSIPCYVDIEYLEQLEQELKFTKDVSTLHTLYEKICELYKGDFLPLSAYESWVIPISAYYHSLYLKITSNYIRLLQTEHEYSMIASLCCKALLIDNYDEDLHYYFIQALYRSGKQSAAKEQFSIAKKLLATHCNSPLSNRFLLLQNEINQSIITSSDNIHTVQENLTSISEQYGVLLCDYAIFKELYQLELDACNKLREPLLLCLITLTNRLRSKLANTTIPKAMDTLIECFNDILRPKDIVSKYSSNQFILLLPNLTQQEGQDYLEQIRMYFSKSTFRSFIQLDYSLLSVTLVLS